MIIIKKYTIEKLSKAENLSQKEIRRQIAAGLLDANKKNNKYIIDEKAVIKWKKSDKTLSDKEKQWIKTNMNNDQSLNNKTSKAKWVDISQVDYGVALMNDCKYGYKVKENILDLNLLRSPEYPGEKADRGKHVFTYSLYPHQGDYREGNVVQEAYELNNPLQIKSINNDSKSVEEGIKPESSIIDIEKENIVIKSIKKAEKDDNIIIRLYESYGRETSTGIKFNLIKDTIKEVLLTDLMEDSKKQLNLKDNKVELNFSPFTIHTIKVITQSK